MAHTMEDQLIDAMEKLVTGRDLATDVAEYAETCKRRSMLLHSLVEETLLVIEPRRLLAISMLAHASIQIAGQVDDAMMPIEGRLHRAMREMSSFAAASELGDIVAQGEAVKAFNEEIDANAAASAAVDIYVKQALQTCADFNGKFPTLTIR